MKKIIALSSLFICSVAFANSNELTFSRYSKGQKGKENWQEFKYYKIGNLIKVAYNDAKQKNESSLIITAFWKDREEKAIKMRVRFSAASKDLYLLKLYKTSGGGYATLEKIEGNVLYPYFRRFEEQKNE